MTDPGSSPLGNRDRGDLFIALALVAAILLLAAILVMLISISRNGLDIRVQGDVGVDGLGDQITVHLAADEPIVLSMPQPVQMVATGPDGEAVPATLALATCPECGGPMLPTRWNPWTGEIEWTCPACGETLSEPSTP